MGGRPHALAASTPGKDPVPIAQEAGWAPGLLWTGGKSRPHRDSIPDRPARSQSLYRLSYPARPRRSHLINYKFQVTHWWSNLSWHGPRTSFYENMPVVAVILDAPVQAYRHRPCKGRKPYFAGSMFVANQFDFICVLSFGWFPGVEILYADVSEHCSIFITSAYKVQTPGNHQKETIQHSEYGESLKSRLHLLIKTSLYENVTSRSVVTRQWTSSS